jgi:hypothetical protein
MDCRLVTDIPATTEASFGMYIDSIHFISQKVYMNKKFNNIKSYKLELEITFLIEIWLTKKIQA